MSASESRHSGTRSPRELVLAGLASLLTKRAMAVVSLALVLSGISAWYAAANLKLDANTDSLIAPERAFMKIYRDFMNDFGDLEYLYIAVDSHGDSQAAQLAVDELSARLVALGTIPGIYATISPEEQWRLAPRASQTKELEELVRASVALESLTTRHATCNALLEEADASVAQLLSRGAGMSATEREATATRAITLVKALTAVSGDDFGLAQQLATKYLTSQTGRLYFIEILPQKHFDSLDTIEATLREIRAVVADVARHHRTVDIGLTGKPVLQADELATTNEDMTRGTIVATILITLITIVTFRSVAGTLLTTAVLGLAFALTYGAAALLVGRLNLLSLVFMLVLVSAGIDYGIHIVARYSELKRTHPPIDALRQAIVLNTIPVWTGALTSAAVFFTALFTDFGGLAELGIVAGSGLVICALLFTTVLPAALAMCDSRAKHRRVAEPDGQPIEQSPSTTPQFIATPTRRSIAWTLALATVATLVFAAATGLLRFESNLLKLQADGLESVEWEHRILDDSVSASWFGAIICKSQSEVERISTAALAAPSIEAVHSVLDLVRPDTPQRDALRQQLATAIPQVTSPLADSPRPDSDTPDLQLVKRVESRLNQLISLASLQAGPEELLPFKSAVAGLSRLAHELSNDATSAAAALQVRTSLSNTANALTAIGEGARAGLRESLPQAVRARFVSPSGSMLVSLFPREDLWEFEPLSNFVAAMRSIDPAATGVPVTVYESVLDMRSAFTLMSSASLIIIALLVWLDFRSIAATATCLIALGVAMIWTFGLMAIMGVSLNLANFFGVPMLLGFGIDSFVHLVHRARETGHGAALGWTMRAVMLSAITTAIGFGTLLFASHKGLQSLGWLIVVGSIACLICSRTVLPAVLCRFPQIMGSRP